MSYYDPYRVFNHRRTADQRKGQSIQTKLVDQVEPRVDPEVLRKAKRLCEVYNLIPQQRMPLQIKITDVEIEGPGNSGYQYSWIYNYLTSINAPDGYYYYQFVSTDGVTALSNSTISISNYEILHYERNSPNASIEGSNIEFFTNGFTNSQSINSTNIVGHYGVNNYVYGRSLSKVDSSTAATVSSTATYTVWIFELVNYNQ